MRGARIFVLMTVLILGGCGGSEDTTEDADRNCIITFSGNELCGESGKAWCERFADRVTADAETRSACASVGANLATGADLSEEDKRVFGDEPELRSELTQEFPNLEPIVTFEGGKLDVVVGSEHTSRVSKRQLSKLCDSIGEYYIDEAEPPETTISDVNNATSHRCKFSGY